MTLLEVCVLLNDPSFDRSDLIIHNKISFYRKKLGLSQTKLGKMVGLSQNTISAYETETYFPTLSHGILLSLALGCEIDDLFYFEVGG